MTHVFKNLQNIQNFVLRIIQLMSDTWTTDFEKAVDKIKEYITNWNKCYISNLYNSKDAVFNFTSDVVNDAAKFNIDVFEAGSMYSIIIYYSKDSSKPVYSIIIKNKKGIIMAQFDSENLEKYTHSLPTLDREVAYDIYATYLDYTENVKNFGYDSWNSEKLQKYEKYIKTKFQNSKLLNKILSVLQTADKNRLLYLTGDVDNTVSAIKSLIQ